MTAGAAAIEAGGRRLGSPWKQHFGDSQDHYSLYSSEIVKVKGQNWLGQRLEGVLNLYFSIGFETCLLYT